MLVIYVNEFATAALFYMTLVNLPYLVLALAPTNLIYSSFVGAILWPGYSCVREFLLTSIGNRSAEFPVPIVLPGTVLLTSAAYALILCCSPGSFAARIWAADALQKRRIKTE